MRVFIGLIALLALFAVACGDDDQEPEGDPPSLSATTSVSAQWTEQYLTLGEARQLLSGLGLEGVSLAPSAYECIQFTCPDEAPGDDSWGCLSLLATGDPNNVDSLRRPDDPPGWYSVVWRGASGETYGTPPEPVVDEPTVVLEHHEEIACGAGFALETSAEEGASFLKDAGLEGVWQTQALPAPTCPTATTCPIPGVPADTIGCVGISIFDLPERTQTGPRVTVYINWSGRSVDQPDGSNLTYSITRGVSEFEAAVASLTAGSCYDSAGPPADPYDWVPYTEVLQPTYWRLTEAPDGKTLELEIAAGGGCEEYERVDVFETEESVTINAYIRHSTPGPNGACTDELNIHQASVELDKPLGDRELLGCAPAEIWYVDHDVDCAEPGHV